MRKYKKDNRSVPQRKALPSAPAASCTRRYAASWLLPGVLWICRYSPAPLWWHKHSWAEETFYFWGGGGRGYEKLITRSLVKDWIHSVLIQNDCWIECEEHKLSPASWAFANCFSASALLSPLFSSWRQTRARQRGNIRQNFIRRSSFFEILQPKRWQNVQPGARGHRTDLWWFELRGFAVKHIHRLDAVLQHADRPVEHSHQVAENEEIEEVNTTVLLRGIPSVELQSLSIPGCQTLLSLPPHSAEGSRPGVQQSGTGRCTWRHQWQFSSLQDVQKKKKAKWRNVTQHVMFKTILRNLRVTLCIHCYIHITDKLKNYS